MASIVRRCTVWRLKHESVSIFYVGSAAILLQCCLSAENFLCELFSVGTTEVCVHLKLITKNCKFQSTSASQINRRRFLRLPAECISTNIPYTVHCVN